MTERQKVYGIKKQFISEHWNDILVLRKRMSASKVANVYGGIITRKDIYNFERLVQK